MRPDRLRSRSVAAAAAALLLVGAGACGDDDDPADVEAESIDADYVDLAIEVDDIGDEVTVAGEVTDVRGPTFLLVTPRAPGSSILVAHRVEPPVEDAVVNVTGLLREVDTTHLEEELEIDLPRDVFERFNGDLVIAATAVDD